MIDKAVAGDVIYHELTEDGVTTTGALDYAVDCVEIPPGVGDPITPVSTGD